MVYQGFYNSYNSLADDKWPKHKSFTLFTCYIDILDTMIKIFSESNFLWCLLNVKSLNSFWLSTHRPVLHSISKWVSMGEHFWSQFKMGKLRVEENKKYCSNFSLLVPSISDLCTWNWDQIKGDRKNVRHDCYSFYTLHC